MHSTPYAANGFVQQVGPPLEDCAILRIIDVKFGDTGLIAVSLNDLETLRLRDEETVSALFNLENPKGNPYGTVHIADLGDIKKASLKESSLHRTGRLDSRWRTLITVEDELGRREAMRHSGERTQPAYTPEI